MGFSMTMKDTSTDQSTTATARKPYEKPTFRHEEVFVTTALGCGKITQTQSGCGFSQKAS